MGEAVKNGKTYTVRGFVSGEEHYVADLHRRLYAEEYSWGDAFIQYAVNVALEFAVRPKNEREEMFIAVCDGNPVGCIMLCQTEEPSVGQLRLFAVEKAYRGCGIGGALVDALMQKAAEAGYAKLILWTASPLTAAIRQYERMGFHATESVDNTTWSTDGSVVQEVKMEMDLP